MSKTLRRFNGGLQNKLCFSEMDRKIRKLTVFLLNYYFVIIEHFLDGLSPIFI